MSRAPAPGSLVLERGARSAEAPTLGHWQVPGHCSPSNHGPLRHARATCRLYLCRLHYKFQSCQRLPDMRLGEHAYAAKKTPGHHPCTEINFGLAEQTQPEPEWNLLTHECLLLHISSVCRKSILIGTPDSMGSHEDQLAAST